MIAKKKVGKGLLRVCGDVGKRKGRTKKEEQARFKRVEQIRAAKKDVPMTRSIR